MVERALRHAGRLQDGAQADGAETAGSQNIATRIQQVLAGVEVFVWLIDGGLCVHGRHSNT